MGTQRIIQLCVGTVILMARLGSAIASSRGELFMNVMMQNFQSNLGERRYALRITAFEQNTNVSVIVNKDTFKRNVMLNKDMTLSVELPTNIEMLGNTKFDKTVIVKANKPITVLSLNQKFQSGDVTVVYPYTCLGTEYFLVTPDKGPAGTKPECAIIAGPESTSVDLHLKSDVVFMGKNYAANSILQITLEPWQAVQVQGEKDLSGTRIESTQPVAVLTGHTCAWEYTKCDLVCEQLLPVSSWGSDYMVAPLSIQRKTDIITIVAHTHTRLDYEARKEKHTAYLTAGGVIKIENEKNPVIIRSNVSIQVTLYSNGGTTGRIAYDPFLINIPSVDAYCKSYYIYGQQDYTNYALMMSKTSATAGITFDSKNMTSSVKWIQIPGTNYSYAEYSYGDSLTSHLVQHQTEPFGLLSIGIASLRSYGTRGTCTEAPATCSTVVCEKNRICKMVDGKPQCVSDSFASCRCSGDPHCMSFDGKRYDFQGTCTYTIAKSCGVNSQLPEFSVEAKNKNRGNTRVSYVSVVTVLAYNHNITMVAHEVGRVRVDGIISYLPIFLNGTMLHIYQCGENNVVKTDFGLRVLYDSYSHLQVELSGRYSESVCGMCGNNNKDPKDDFATPDGKQAASMEEFGKSWKVDDGDQHCWHDCNGPCKTCPPGLVKKYQSVGFCGLIAKETDGPFSQCQATHDPKGFLENCVYDVCLNGGSKREACEALKAYADVCQRDGVVITDWRKAAKCPLKCGPNSQYKVCGSACPNTCEDDTASTKCGYPCMEGCECNAGFVLSQGKCVPKSTCGCNYKGFPYAQNQVFWEDDKCESQCTCDPTTKQVECKPAKCKVSEKCNIVNGVRGCHPVSYGTCLASGDPHYDTFDNKRFDFQGTCVYMFSGLCDKSQGLVDFQVHVQNNHRGSKVVAFTKVVTAIVYDMNFTMDTRYPGRVMVNSTLVNLPFYTAENNVIAYKACHDVVLITKFGMKVTFDCKSRITVTLPSTYAGAVCGLCGDFNGDKSNDLTLKDGRIASNPTAFGDSWKVRDIPGCKVNESSPVCRNLKEMEEQQRKYETDCGVPLGKKGPFRDCHSKVDPEGYFKDCIFDSCFYKGRQEIFCQILGAYAAACQLAGATVYSWRTNTFCPIMCPKNSHYEMCTNGCPITCDGLTPPVGCDTTCGEGCACNDGFVLSGDQCVDMSQCGCVYNGQYYTDNQVFYPDKKCDQQCTCRDGGVITCTPFSCGPNEECTLAEGIQKCRPVGSATCRTSGGVHYTSFDGLHFDFQGNCTYTLVKPCGGDKNLTAFIVHVTNRKRGNGKVTVTRRVDVEVNNYTLSMIDEENDLLVNGVHYKLSVTLLNGKLKAVKQGKKWSIETYFGLKIQYDMNHNVRVTIPANYKGEMCGLCGNYNGDKADEFLLPDSQLTTDVNTFGKAWTVPTDEICNPDICGPSDPCISCDDKKNKVFNNKEYCGFLTDADGPLSDCYGTIQRDDYFKDCVYDLCAGNGDITILCQNIEAYVAECQAAGVTMKPWRNDSFCPMSCPANSSYKTCTTNCDASCFGLVDPVDCSDDCAEGWQCDEDYFFDGEQCVTMDQCGCYENGRYYAPEKTVLSNDCTEICACSPVGGLLCEEHNCTDDEECRIEDGTMQCINIDPCKSKKCREKENCTLIDGKAQCVPQFDSTCWCWGEPHCQTYDGQNYDFQGTCTYAVSKYCGSDPTLVPFSINAKNDIRGGMQGVSFVTAIDLFIYGFKISVRRGDFPKIRINDTLSNLPAVLYSGKITVTRRGLTAQINTEAGIRLMFDWDARFDLTLPSSYYGATCGLCGNFNQNPADDMVFPNGTQASAIVEWAGSWKVKDRDPFCWDFCPGDCPTCEESEKSKYSSDQFCGIISNTTDGPFRECHSIVNPDDFFDSCLYDVCTYGGANIMLCKALGAYASTCLKQKAKVFDWRTPSQCPLPCPENSHYEACGNACPASCLDRTAPDRCTYPCVETCQCDEGLVLSGDQCVAIESCGCNFMGMYYKPDEEFWLDNSCGKRCTCDPALGMVVCHTTKCKDTEKCMVVNGVRGCFPISYATCSAWGDTHYTSFDGKKFDFMGTCVYQMVEVTSSDPTLPRFTVTVQNENRGNKPVAYTKVVTLSVDDMNITMSKDYPGQIKVNEAFIELPYYFGGDKVNAFFSGNDIVIKMDSGVTVKSDRNSFVRVTIPSSYGKAVSGLCGNNNGNADDDLTMKDGNPAPDAVQFGDSWQVSEVPGCTPVCTGNCPICSGEQEQEYKTEEYCGIITKPNGPFSQCKEAIDPTPYFTACVFDTCSNQGHHLIMCSAIQAYVTMCQAKGINIEEWRTHKFCSPSCPDNSHYELCATGCPETCYGLCSPAGCDAPCTEGCFCDSRYLLSGDKCVPMADCGCVYMGRYYQRGQEFYPGDLCQEECKCMENGAVECVNTSCTANEECKVVNGVLGCHPSGFGTCVAAGGIHYLTLDSRAFDFHGTCTYTLMTVCGSSSGPPFSVVVDNEPYGNSNVVDTKLVMSVYGYNITIQRGTSWKVKVDRELYNLPANLDGVTINQEGNNIVTRTDFGVEILYDCMNYLQMKVPSTYKNQTCGLCGNFNDDQSDDFLLPNGEPSQNVDEFGKAWKVNVKGSTCIDGCGNKCPMCHDNMITPYKTDEKCGFINATDGPFQNCHKLVDPTNYFKHCLSDMCAASGSQDALCSNLQAYAAACQDAGAVIPAWRELSSCPLTCPANSHYEICTRTCEYTCAALLGPTKCTDRCYEGCESDAGYVFDGDSCVPRNACGCMYKGRYLKANERLVTPLCGEICTCGIDGVVGCAPLTCGPEQVCEYRNNVIGCYRTHSQCTISMGLKFTSFDGKEGKMPSSGAFEVASMCDSKSADFFRIVVDMQQCSPDGQKAMVYIILQKAFIAVNYKKKAWLTGRPLPIPVTVNGVIKVYTIKEDFIIEEKNKIRVTIGPNGDVTVQVWQAFYGQLCSACGNFNDNPEDDLQLAGGGQGSDMSQVIQSWRAPDFYACAT